ncbi:MAG: leucine-rich repeat domain-containing protein [bacterium]
MKSLFKLPSLCLVMILAVLQASCPPKDEAPSAAKKERPKGREKAVRFSHPKLETQIRRKLGKPEGPLMNTELTAIKELDLSGKNITELNGLEHCTRLARLDLGSNYLRDISPLAGLTNLVLLNLEENYIADLAPLSGLVKLEELNLRSNRIRDISPLKDLHNLRILNLAGNQVKDLSPLARLHQLHRLDLAGNNINDLSGLVRNCEAGGISKNDTVVLTGNPMGPNARLRQIPALQECGAEVIY